MKENEFVHIDDTDLYICIIDSGLGEKPELGKTKFLTRYKVEFFKDREEPEEYNGFKNGLMPVRFIYDGSATPVVENGDFPVDPELGAIQNILLGVFGSGLGYYAPSYIRDGAVVRLIVPYDLGPSSLASSGEPIYFPRVTYSFE